MADLELDEEINLDGLIRSVFASFDRKAIELIAATAGETRLLPAE